MIQKPLEGIKVIDFSTYVAAPACGRLLRDMGARVIKIEAAKGDAWRTYGSSHHVVAEEDENPFFDLVNAGKESIVLNLKDKKGKDILFKLLKDADIFLTNTRPKSLKKLGLDYDSLKPIFPKLIYASITGFGEVGPEVDSPGFDIVAFWGKSGFLNDLAVNTGTNYPTLAPIAVGDLICASSLFGGVCTALYARERSGHGDYVTVSLFGNAIWAMGCMYIRAQERYGDTFPKTRLEGSPLESPYLCKDGQWVLLSILEYERYFPTLCKAMGFDSLASDPRFKTKFTAEENKEVLFELLEKRFREEDSAYWLKVLKENDLVNDRLNHFKDVVHSEQAWVNNFLTKAKFPNGNECVMPCPPIRLKSVGAAGYKRGPFLGENTADVLKEIGLNEEEIESLEKENVIMRHK